MHQVHYRRHRQVVCAGRGKYTCILIMTSRAFCQYVSQECLLKLLADKSHHRPKFINHLHLQQAVAHSASHYHHHRSPTENVKRSTTTRRWLSLRLMLHSFKCADMLGAAYIMTITDFKHTLVYISRRILSSPLLSLWYIASIYERFLI